MSGPDVVAVQVALGVDADGLYGPVTAGAASDWKFRSGYPLGAVDGTLAPDDQGALLGRRPLPAGFAARARERAGETDRAALVRGLAVAEMEAWARRGVRERPAGGDRVPALMRRARRLGLSDDFARMGYPWCAFAVFLASLEHGGMTADLGLSAGLFNALYTPAILAEAQAGRFGMRVVASDQAQRGDLALFDWGPGGDPTDHVGRLVEAPAGGRVRTVDGNTDDAVGIRDRPIELVRAFVRDS
jgi:hypothetical protein